MCCLRIQFDAVCIVKATDMSCKFYDTKLHTKAETEEWDIMLTGIFDRSDHTVCTAVTKTTRYNNTADITKDLFGILFIDLFRRNPFDRYIALMSKSAMF